MQDYTERLVEKARKACKLRWQATTFAKKREYAQTMVDLRKLVDEWDSIQERELEKRLDF